VHTRRCAVAEYLDESVRFGSLNTDLVGDEAPQNAVVVTVEPAPDAETILTGFQVLPPAPAKA
jgi:hypothetical protein